MRYGDRLRLLRTLKGVTQAEMADIVGKSLSAYKLWESNSNEPNIYSLELMADYFNVTIDFLVGRPTEEERNTVSEFEKQLLPTQRGEYIRLLQTIQKSLVYNNAPTLELYIEDEQLLKIESMRILAEALYKLHSFPVKIQVKVERASEKELIGQLDNNEIIIDANVSKAQIQHMQQAFFDINETMLNYILGMGLKIDKE